MLGNTKVQPIGGFQTQSGVQTAFTPGPWAVDGQTVYEIATRQAIQPTQQNLQLVAHSPAMFDTLEKIAGCLSSPDGFVDQKAVQRAQQYALQTIQLVTLGNKGIQG